MSADLTSFADHVLPDWDAAMERFLAAVEDKALARGLDAADVRSALELGYGLEVADAWDEWVEGEGA